MLRLASLVLALGWLASDGAQTSWGKPSQIVRLDAPAIAVAEALDASLAPAAATGGDVFRIRLSITALIQPEFRGKVEALVVAVHNPNRTLRVVDFWPKTEMASTIDGPIAVQNQLEQQQNFAFAVAGGYQALVGGQAQGDFHGKQRLEERYQRRAPMQLVTASGAIDRGSGVCFQFHPGPANALDGTRDIALLVEAPRGWRADLLNISIRALGANSSLSSPTSDLASEQLWTVVHRAIDSEAAAAARRFVTTEQTVRKLAIAHQLTIEKRALPTVFHKMGAALEVVQPKIPDDYLQQLIFNLDMQYFDEPTSRLPVDLRVAVLDYWDERSKLLMLASNQL